LNDGPPFPSAPSSIAAHGTKLAETVVQNDADLLANKELEKLGRNEAKESVQDATTDPTLRRTTKSDPLENLADTLEHEMSKEGRSSVGDRMHQLERIINAVQTMLEEPEKDEKVGASIASQEKSKRKSLSALFEYPLSQLRAQILVAPTGTPQIRRPVPTTPRPPFTRPQTLSPFPNKNHQHPYRESNERPEWDNTPDDDPDFQQQDSHSSNLHSNIRNRLFSPINPKTQWTNEEEPRVERHQFNMDPEIGILKKLGTVYSSLFNMMARELGDYDDGLSLKRHQIP
jgi:hypothetical protein